ncbi:MAG: hypothetical protein ACXWYE_06955 [Actinomycetota bacterium]
MHIRLLRAVVGLTVVGLASVSGIASAGTLIETTVTIKTQNGDFWGKVVSPRPKLCARERKVVVFKQLGAEQNPANDQKIANDTASLSGGVYEWNTGNTGAMNGRYYARVGRTTSCQADTSETVKVRR